jgi:hypothetical protein
VDGDAAGAGAVARGRPARLEDRGAERIGACARRQDDVSVTAPARRPLERGPDGVEARFGGDVDGDPGVGAEVLVAAVEWPLPGLAGCAADDAAEARAAADEDVLESVLLRHGRRLRRGH